MSVVSAIAAIAGALAFEAPDQFGREVLRVRGAPAVAAGQDAPAPAKRRHHRFGGGRRRPGRRHGFAIVQARGLGEHRRDHLGILRGHQRLLPARRRSFSIVARNCSSVTCVGASNFTGVSTCTG